MNWDSRQPMNRQGLLFKNNFDNSTRTFKKENSKVPLKSPERNRIPRFIAFPYYGIYGGDDYEDGRKEALTIIVESNKKDETTNSPTRTEKPVAPPHIVTLDDKESHNHSKPTGHEDRVVEIRGTEVSVVRILSE